MIPIRPTSKGVHKRFLADPRQYKHKLFRAVTKGRIWPVTADFGRLFYRLVKNLSYPLDNTTLGVV